MFFNDFSEDSTKNSKKTSKKNFTTFLIQNLKQIFFIVFFLYRSLSLELVTNAVDMLRVSHVRSNAIYAKDYYVLIMDDYAKVKDLVNILEKRKEWQQIKIKSHTIFK